MVGRSVGLLFEGERGGIVGRLVDQSATRGMTGQPVGLLIEKRMEGLMQANIMSIITGRIRDALTTTACIIELECWILPKIVVIDRSIMNDSVKIILAVFNIKCDNIVTVAVVGLICHVYFFCQLGVVLG